MCEIVIQFFQIQLDSNPGDEFDPWSKRQTVSQIVNLLLSLSAQHIDLMTILKYRNNLHCVRAPNTDCQIVEKQKS